MFHTCQTIAANSFVQRELYFIVILNLKENNDKIVWQTIMNIAGMRSKQKDKG